MGETITFKPKQFNYSVLPRLLDAVKVLDENKEYTIKLDKVRKKRSLTANSYYWRLLGEMAKQNRISTNYQHNLLLRRYGQMEKVGGNIVTVDIPEDDENEAIANESETIHLKPTSQTRTAKNGALYRTYILLRGSHTYSTEEMSRLIDGTVSEAKEMGIEVISDSERALLLEEWGNGG